MAKGCMWRFLQLMFALFHCNAAQLLYTLCVGAALAALYARTGRLWAAVLGRTWL